jgi:hypothetical protein
VYSGPIPPPSPGQWPYKTYGNWKVQNHSWYFAGLLLGVYEQLPINNKNVLFTAKAMAGPIYVFGPEIKGESVSDTAIVQGKEPGSSALGFAYSIAIEAKYKASKKIRLVAELQYLGTNKIIFKNVTSSFSVAQYSNSIPGSFTVEGGKMNRTQHIQSVNLNLGIELPL